MLDKLRVEFTKSRPRHSNDNGLAETKNGAVIRKHLGYAHIPQCFAAAVNAFCAEHLNPYLNFHRPCLFAEEITDPKGKIRKTLPATLGHDPVRKTGHPRAAPPGCSASPHQRHEAPALNQARAALQPHRRQRSDAAQL